MGLIKSKYAGRCIACDHQISAGDSVEWRKGRKGVRCKRCFEEGRQPPGAPEPRTRERANDPKRVDQLARELPGRAGRIAQMVETGRAAYALQDALQVAIDLNLVLKDRDYELRMVIESE